MTQGKTAATLGQRCGAKQYASFPRKLTCYGSASDLALAREAGFDGHLVKPVEFNDLERMMAAPAAPQP